MGLDAIRRLLEESVIETNTSDGRMAAHIAKLRESALPTEAEMKLWPPPYSASEVELRRSKARGLFVEGALPPALTSIMSSAASCDALGKVFDALQMQEVSRGLVFAILLQAARVIIY